MPFEKISQVAARETAQPAWMVLVVSVIVLVAARVVGALQTSRARDTSACTHGHPVRHTAELNRGWYGDERLRSDRHSRSGLPGPRGFPGSSG